MVSTGKPGDVPKGEDWKEASKDDLDHGLVPNYTQEQVNQDWEERGLKFKYFCEKENNPKCTFRLYFTLFLHYSISIYTLFSKLFLSCCFSACHSLGVFYNMFKRQPGDAHRVWLENCEKNGFGPSCVEAARPYLQMSEPFIVLLHLVSCVLCPITPLKCHPPQ